MKSLMGRDDLGAVGIEREIVLDRAVRMPDAKAPGTSVVAQIRDKINPLLMRAQRDPRIAKTDGDCDGYGPEGKWPLVDTGFGNDTY